MEGFQETVQEESTGVEKHPVGTGDASGDVCSDSRYLFTN